MINDVEFVSFSLDLFNTIVSFTCNLNRVAVGMGIPTGFPYGWEWEFILAYGNSDFPHVGILWEFPQKSCGNGNGNSLPTATLVIYPKPLSFRKSD